MKYLKLGDNATSFYDMGTGLKISGKDVVAVNEAYINQGKRTRRALQGGHLIYATKEEYEEANGVKAESENNTVENTVESLSKKFYNLYQSGKSTKELADAFNKAQLVKIAEAAELEVEEADTKSSLVEAIIEQIESTDEETDEE